MTVYMDKKDYETFTRLKGKFTRVLYECAQEISLISNGRSLIGEWNGDIDLWDGDDTGRYRVEFERYSCGETDYDTVYVPMPYIYDKGYREYYNKRLIMEKEIVAQAALDRWEARRKANTYHVITDERVTYEMLKKKFGDES